MEEDVELEVDVTPNPALLFDLDCEFEYGDCVPNFGCECDRRSELAEK